MTQRPQIGDNATGMGAAPERSQRMLEGPLEFPAPEGGDAGAADEVRGEYARAGIPRGSIPRVGIEGEEVGPDLAPLLDKMGARLSFERAGTRFYEGLIAKVDAGGSFDGGPARAELEEIRAQEHAHVNLLIESILEIGGDPTAVTPSAGLETSAGKGIGDVIADPRVSLVEGLEAILIAELADRESWEGLIELAEMAEHVELADRFRDALDVEELHLEKVRTWVAAAHGRTRH